eukprot:TRINITY_DN8247_c0_g1_i1.p1 TRINITY_DN8247_c0_g1~~TRINITY_DN8247_c0_g1_i1.p1  ORF type:complete len:930 (-),score=211.57 TRINITY_DN8247_c0_g1_i1:79-2667(-)
MTTSTYDIHNTTPIMHPPSTSTIRSTNGSAPTNSTSPQSPPSSIQQQILNSKQKNNRALSPDPLPPSSSPLDLFMYPVMVSPLILPDTTVHLRRSGILDPKPSERARPPTMLQYDFVLVSKLPLAAPHFRVHVGPTLHHVGLGGCGSIYYEYDKWMPRPNYDVTAPESPPPLDVSGHVRIRVSPEEMASIVTFHNFFMGTVLCRPEFAMEGGRTPMPRKDLIPPMGFTDMYVLPASVLAAGRDLFAQNLPTEMAASEAINFRHLEDCMTFVPFNHARDSSKSYAGCILRTLYSQPPRYYAAFCVDPNTMPFSKTNFSRRESKQGHTSSSSAPSSSSDLAPSLPDAEDGEIADDTPKSHEYMTYEEYYKSEKDLTVTRRDDPLLSSSHCSSRRMLEAAVSDYEVMYNPDGSLSIPQDRYHAGIQDGYRDDIFTCFGLEPHSKNSIYLIPEFCERSELTIREYLVGRAILPWLLYEVQFWGSMFHVMRVLDVPFKDMKRLRQAFIHPSYYQSVAIDNRMPGVKKKKNYTADIHLHYHNYQRLEYLGDTVLKFIATMMLYSRFPSLNEGNLTQRRADVINNQSLMRVCRGLQLDKLVLLGAGGSATGKAAADVVESLLGAIYLDYGLDGAQRFCERFLSHHPAFTFQPGDVETLPPLYNGPLPAPYQMFQNHIGISFTHPGLLIQAFTHPSYASKHALPSFERLEFAGDAVLDLVMSDHMYRTCPNKNEGDMTQYKSSIVSNSTFTDVCVRDLKAAHLLLHNLNSSVPAPSSTSPNTTIIMPPSDPDSLDLVKRNGRMSDAFEALVGAIYLDQGIDVAAGFIRRYLIDPRFSAVRYEVDSRISNEKLARRHVDESRYSSIPTPPL